MRPKSSFTILVEGLLGFVFFLLLTWLISRF